MLENQPRRAFNIIDVKPRIASVCSRATLELQRTGVEIDIDQRVQE